MSCTNSSFSFILRRNLEDDATPTKRAMSTGINKYRLSRSFTGRTLSGNISQLSVCKVELSLNKLVTRPKMAGLHLEVG